MITSSVYQANNSDRDALMCNLKQQIKLKNIRGITRLDIIPGDKSDETISETKSLNDE